MERGFESCDSQLRDFSCFISPTIPEFEETREEAGTIVED